MQEANEADYISPPNSSAWSGGSSSDAPHSPNLSPPLDVNHGCHEVDPTPTAPAPDLPPPPSADLDAVDPDNIAPDVSSPTAQQPACQKSSATATADDEDVIYIDLTRRPGHGQEASNPRSQKPEVSTEQPQAAAEPKTPVKLAKPSNQILQELLGRRAGCLRSPVPGIPCDLDRVEGIEDLQEVELVADGEEDALTASSVPAPVSQQASGGVTDDSSQRQAMQCADSAEAARTSSGASCPSPVGHDQGLTSPPASPSQQQVYSIVQGIVSQAVQMVVSAPPLPTPSGSSAAADSNPAVTPQGLGPGRRLGLGTAEVDGDMKEALVSTATVPAALAPEEDLDNKQCLDCDYGLARAEAPHQASPSPPGATGPPELAGTPGRDSELASQGSFTAAAALQLQAAPPSHMQGGSSQGEGAASPQLSTLPLQHSIEPGDVEAAGSEQHSPTVRLGALSAFPVAGPAADRYASDPDSPSNAAADMRHVYNQASAWPTQAVELPSSWSSDPSSSSNITSDCTALHQEEEQDEEQEEEEEEVVWVAQPRSLLMASLRGAQRQSMTSLKEAALREEAAQHLAAQAPGSKPAGPQTRPTGVKPPQLPAATKLLAHAQCASHKASSIGSSSNSGADPSSGTPEQDAPEPSLQAPSSASPSTLVSPFALAGLKAILGKKGSMQSLKPQHSAPAPVLSQHHSGSSEVEPSLSHRKGPRLASRASAVDSAFSCEGGPFAALASKHSVSAGSTLQQPAPQDLPSVSLGSAATNSAAGTAAQGRLSQSGAEEAPGCASNQPPPALDNGVEDSIDNFLRDRCIICPRYPSDQVKKRTGTGHAQLVPPPLGPKVRVEAGEEEEEEGDEEEEAQEVDEDEFLAEDYDENDIEYSFDEEDDEDDIATTVMPVTRSEIASARMEIDKLRKELQEQQAVNSGLRGELRKFTTLASRLTAQLQAGKPAAILTPAAGPVTTGCVGAATDPTSMAEAATPTTPPAAPAPGVLAMTAGPPPTLPCASGSSVAADSSLAGAPEGLESGQCIAVLQECQDSGAAAVTGGVEEELVGNGSRGEGQGEGHLNSSSRNLAGEEQAPEQHSGNNTDVSACPPAAITAGSSTGEELGPLPTATQPVEQQGAPSEDSEGPPAAGYGTPSAGTAGLAAAAGDAPSPAAASSAVLALTASKVGKTRAGKGPLGARAVGPSQGLSHSPQQMEAAAWKLERSMLLKHMADLKAKVKELEATQAGSSPAPTSPPPLDVSHSLHPPSAALASPAAASTPACTEAETDLVPAEQDGVQVRSPASPPDAPVVMLGAANDVIHTDLTKRPGHDQPAGSHAEPASSSADQSRAAADAETHAANSLAARALLLSEREHFTQLLAQADLRALTAEQTLVHTLRQTQLQLDEVGMESAVLKGLVGTARSVVVGLRQQLSSALESAATQQRTAAETAEKLQQQVQHLQQEAKQTASLRQLAAEQAEAARLDGEHAARALQAELEQQLQTQLKEQADKIVFLEAELNRQQQLQAAAAAPDATPTKPPEPGLLAQLQPEVAAYQQLTNRCATLQAELHLQTAAAEQLAKHCVALEHQLAQQAAAADSQGQQMGGAHVSSPLQAMRLPGIMGQLASAEQKLAKLQSKYDATKRQLLQLQAAALGGSAVPPGGSETACSNPGSPLQPLQPSVVETSRLRLAALLQLVAATEAKLCKPSPLLGATSPKGPSPCASCGSVEAGSGGASAGSVLLEENALLLGLDALTRKLERRVRNVLLAALEAQQGQRQLLRQLIGTQARQGASLSQPASVLVVSSFPSSGLTSQQMTPTAVPASPAATEDVSEPPVLHTPQGGASPASQSLSGMTGGWEPGGQELRVGAARQRAWEEQAELPQPRPRPLVRSEPQHGLNDQPDDTAARTSLPDPPSASLEPPASATAAAAQDARHQQGAEAGMASATSGSATLELRRQLASQAAVNAQLALQLAEMNRRLGPTPLTNHQPVATTYTTTSRQQGSQSSALQGPSPASTPARETGAQPGHPAASSPLSPWSPWFHYPMAGPTAARPGPDLLHNSWAAPRTAGPTQAPPQHNYLLTSPLAQPNPHKALQYPGHAAGQPDPRPVPSSQPQQLRGGHTSRAKVNAGAGLHGAPYSMQFAIGAVPGTRVALSPPPARRPGADIAGAASPGRYASPVGSVYLGTRGGRVMTYTDIYKGLADLPDAQQ